MSGGELTRPKSRALAIVFGALLASIVVGMGLYLPYSGFAKQGEDERRRLAALKQDRTPGGMWNNLNRAAKEAKRA